MNTVGLFPEQPSLGYNIITILPVGTVVADIAKSTAEIESARLLVLSAALQASHFAGHARRATR
jgi:hypothetical protein